MKRIQTALATVQAELSNTQIPAYAANAAFFLFLSVFPSLLFLLSVTQYTIVSMDGILNFLSPIVPDALFPLVAAILEDMTLSNSASILSLSTVFLLWSSSKGVYGLIRGLNQALQIKETRSYLLVRTLCVLYTAAVLAILLITVMLYTLSQEFLLRILVSGSFLYRLLSTILHYRWFVAGLLLLVAFSVSYIVFPCKKFSLRQVLPGSFASSAGWVIFSTLFSYYVKHMGVSSVYGSISIIAFTMLWLYSCMCIFFYGAALNRYIMKKNTANQTERPNTRAV